MSFQLKKNIHKSKELYANLNQGNNTVINNFIADDDESDSEEMNNTILK